jgi:hypothetical protein
MERASGSKSCWTLSSAARITPDEIWMEVFYWYAATFCSFRITPPESTALVLGQVCRRWRAIALSMPRLWNHPPMIRISPKSLESEHFQTGWEAFLLRSRSLPLKLHISLEISTLDIPHRQYDVMQPFLRCSTRWEHLALSGVTAIQAQVQLGPAHGNLSRLSSLTLNFAQTPASYFPRITFDVFQIAPLLTDIKIRSPSTEDNKTAFVFPLGQLTNYKEIGIDISTSEEIFQSEGLDTLHYRCRNFAEVGISPLSSLKLRHLVVEVEGALEFWDQLGYLTLPALETFTFRFLPSPHEQEVPDIVALICLFRRSECCLKALTFDVRRFSIDCDRFLRLFLLLGGLEILEIGACFDDDLEQLIAKLIFKRKRPTVLPRLRSLTLRHEEILAPRPIILRLAASRENVYADDDFPGRLFFPLRHIRIVPDSCTDRHYMMHEVGRWEAHLKMRFDPVSFVGSSLSPPAPTNVIFW